MKYCSLCEKWRSQEEFYPHPNTRDGLQSQCKTCIKISNKVRARAYQRVAQAEPVDNADQSASLVLTGVS